MNYDKIEQDIELLKTGNRGPTCVAAAQSMRLLLDVAKAADAVIECYAITGIPQKNQTMAMVNAERQDKLLRQHVALTALREHCGAQEPICDGDVMRVNATLEPDEIEPWDTCKVEDET